MAGGMARGQVWEPWLSCDNMIAGGMSRDQV